MTKDEIKKALECCEKYAYCKDCPCHTYCEHELHKDVLTLITEQESEIERLNKELSNKETYHRATQALCHSYRNDYWKTFQRLEVQQQEIERLKAENEKRLTCDFAKTAQRQAKIDILNKLKEKAISLSAIETYHICNLVDEMIEELEK